MVPGTGYCQGTLISRIKNYLLDFLALFTEMEVESSPRYYNTYWQAAGHARWGSSGGRAIC